MTISSAFAMATGPAGVPPVSGHLPAGSHRDGRTPTPDLLTDAGTSHPVNNDGQQSTAAGRPSPRRHPLQDDNH